MNGKMWSILVISMLLVQSTGALAAPEPSFASEVYLPLVVGGSTGGGGGGGGGNDPAGALWLPFWLQGGDLLPTYGASAAVDAQGGIHVVYAIYSGTDEQDQKPALYAHCPAGYTDKASWTFTRIGEAVQEARIALDPTGKPRLLLYGPVYDPVWPRMRYQYAACEAG